MGDLHRRPATELVPDSVLDGMERDGWTPSQVRTLIASYRALARELQERHRARAQVASLDFDRLEAEGEALRAKVAKRTRGMVRRD